MSNYNFTKNTTVALDRGGNILWTTEKTSLGGGELNSRAGSADTIIIGDTITSTSGGAIFYGLSNLRKVYVYNQNMYDLTNIYYKNTTVTVVLVENPSILSSLFNYYDKDLFINTGNVLYASDFGAKGDGVTDDTDAINNAIDYVVNNGGKLLFKGDATYIISSSIRICPPSKDTKEDGVVKNFDIDFNNCKVTIAYNESITHQTLATVVYSKSPKFTRPMKSGVDEKGETIYIFSPDDSMIYVNAGYAYEERIGIVQNLQLDPGIGHHIIEGYSISVSSKSFFPGVHTGMYLEASPQISYKNIKICNTTRGIYIGEDSCEIFMDNIHMSKSHGGELDLSVVKAENESLNDYKDSTHVGIDCNSSDCHFSNIFIHDYLIGMRILNGDNRIYNAQVSNEYCTEQRKYSVGYINKDSNYYINCTVDNLYIGWKLSDAVPIFLTNCSWNNADINEKSYAFYITPNHYSGGGIYASGCNTSGPVNSSEESGLSFCNLENYDIHCSGTYENTFNSPTQEAES